MEVSRRIAAAAAEGRTASAPSDASKDDGDGVNGRYCGISGANCSGGNVGAARGRAAGAGAGEPEFAGGISGVGPDGPPLDVGPSASGTAMPGESGGDVGPTSMRGERRGSVGSGDELAAGGPVL